MLGGEIVDGRRFFLWRHLGKRRVGGRRFRRRYFNAPPALGRCVFCVLVVVRGLVSLEAVSAKVFFRKALSSTGTISAQTLLVETMFKRVVLGDTS